MATHRLPDSTGAQKVLRAHPAAALLPLLADDELRALADDIGERGLLEPIVLHEGQVLDGRNRLAACALASVEPRFAEWDGRGGSPTAFVVSSNLQRRHLTPSQRAALALEFLPLFEAEARARKAERAANQMRRQVEQRAQVPQDSDSGTIAGNQEPKQLGRESRDAAAAAVGVSPRYVAQAKQLAETAPELLAQVRAGQLTLSQAAREAKEAQRAEQRAQNAQAVAIAAGAAVVAGPFSTLVIDPPWSWEDMGDSDQLGRARPTYQTLTLDQLKALRIDGKPLGDLMDADAHLYLWVTNRSLPLAWSLFEAWGFRYVTCLTWGKPSFGIGNYFRGQTEHVLFGVRGSLPLARKDVGTLLLADRGPRGHSSKPVEFYPLVESCSPGPYLEVFSRPEQARAGWVHYGEGGVVRG